MPDAYTPNFGWTLPEVGASRDTWGTKLSANLSSQDELLFMAMPIGAVLDYAGPSAPNGWLVADGRLLSRTTYSQLFAAIGTTFGAGDGSTTFALPNLAGRSGVGPGVVTDGFGNSATLNLGTMTGNIAYQIAQAHLPNYALTTDTQGWHAHGGATAPAGYHAHTTDGQGSHSHGGGTGNNNADHTHTGYTDAQGSHNHYVSLYGFAPAAAGGYNVMATVAGGANYYTSTDGSHQHNIQTYGASNGHQHSISADGYHAHNVYAVGDHQHGIYTDGGHSHTIYLGGSSAWFPVVSPIIVVTKIIYAGTQAATHIMAMAADAGGPMVIEGESEEMHEIREELAQLRSLVGMLRGPSQQRRLASPKRGAH